MYFISQIRCDHRKVKESLKKISIILITSVLLFTLSACAYNPSPKDSIGSNTTKKVTLDFLWFSDGVEGKVMKEIIKNYQAKNQKKNLETHQAEALWSQHHHRNLFALLNAI